MVVSKTDVGGFTEIEQGLEGLVHATGPLVSDSAKAGKKISQGAVRKAP